ncbi:hypothetical protein [Clostridium sp.]|uniref:hypothetical protein n=1 Tax=Clostridium sp. TaxID=1506 RepID=UPI003D6D0230
MDKQLTCADCIERLISLQKSAQKRIIEALQEHNNFNIPRYDGKTGIGANTSKNDRRLFVWVPIYDKGNEYLITLFYSEIDKKSGNCHSQVGRIQFVKDIIPSKYIGSPNSVLKEGNDEKEQPTVVEFCSYKWINSLDYMDGKYTKEMCLNKKWLTIDDVNCDDKIPILIAEAFEKFIAEV